jgi:hypothetical protein
MFAAPLLIDRSMTNYSTGVSGNGNRIKSKMAAKYRDKWTSITTVRDQYPSYDIFPTHLTFHYPLPLMITFFIFLQIFSTSPCPTSYRFLKKIFFHVCTVHTHNVQS